MLLVQHVNQYIHVLSSSSGGEMVSVVGMPVGKYLSRDATKTKWRLHSMYYMIYAYIFCKKHIFLQKNIYLAFIKGLPAVFDHC